MAYIGKDALGILSKEKVVDTMTGNGSNTTLSLSGDPVVAHNIEVYIDGVAQYPGTDYTLSGTTLTFTTAPGTDCKVVAISGNDVDIGNPKDGTITTVKITDNSITDAALPSLPATKLTGAALPAINGGSLTGIPSSWPNKHSANPTISTNPSSGVGTVWINKTTGQVFICTDATTGQNKWINVGGHTGTVETPYVFGGEIAGYTAGGSANQPAGAKTISKFSFSTEADATDIGDLVKTRGAGSGGQTDTHGYVLGGWRDGSSSTDTIEKYQFAASSNSTNVAGRISYARQYTGNGNSSETRVYVVAGYGGPNTTMINEFDPTTEGNAFVVGDLTGSTRSRLASQSSTTYGYNAGGNPYSNIIDRFSFASLGNATDVGDMDEGRYGPTGNSSPTHGYVSGGNANSNSPRSTINKFSFASGAVSTPSISLHANVDQNASQSSTTFGYISGNSNDIIQKINFTTDVNAVDVANLPYGGAYAPIGSHN